MLEALLDVGEELPGLGDVGLTTSRSPDWRRATPRPYSANGALALMRIEAS